MNYKKLKLFISLVTTSVALASILNVDKQISGMENDVEADDGFRYQATTPSEVEIEDILYNENNGLMFGLTTEQRDGLAKVFAIVSGCLSDADSDGDFNYPELSQLIRSNNEQFYYWLKHDVTHETNQKEYFDMPGLNDPIPITIYETIEGRLRILFTTLSNMGYWEKEKNETITSEYASKLCNSYHFDDESEAEEEFDDEAKEDPYKGLKIRTETKSYDYTNNSNYCSICLEKLFDKKKSILNQGPILELVCGHQFHEECLKKWFKDKYTCPNCKMDTREEDNNQVKRWYVRIHARKV